FVMGAHGMPRRYWSYVPEFADYHLASTIGSYIFGVGFAFTVGYLVWSVFAGKRAPANPWGGNSLDWHCSSPPHPENFEEAPVVGDPYNFRELVYDPHIAGYVHRREIESATPPDAPAE